MVQGLGLSIVNNKSSSLTINLRGTEFLWIGPNAGPVTVNGGPGMVLQNGKANSSTGSDSGNGGAIDYEDTNSSSTFNPSSALNVSNVTFTGNSATNDGGAIYAGPGSGPVDVNNSIFGTGSSATPGNASGGNGGAIDYEGSYSLTITNSSFVGNSAGNPQRGGGGNGGAVEIGGSDGAAAQCGTASLTNCQFGTSYDPLFEVLGAPPLPPQGNTAMKYGGAIDYEAQLNNNNNSTSLSLTNVTFRQSNALNGGALFVGGGTGPVTVNGSKFGDTYPTFDNGADGNGAQGGGAIFDFGESSLTITSTSFLYNSAVDGGAVYYAGKGALRVGANSAFSFNSAYDPIGDLPASGGAIYIGNPGNSSAAVPAPSLTARRLPITLPGVAEEAGLAATPRGVPSRIPARPSRSPIPPSRATRP